jgi:hypothetical protein
MLAEGEINRRRGARPNEFVNIEFLILSSAAAQVSGVGGFPLDLLVVMLWAGLRWEDPTLSIQMVPSLMEASPLTRGAIATKIWDAYMLQSKRSKEPEGQAEGANGDKDPLAPRPGSNTGVLQ